MPTGEHRERRRVRERRGAEQCARAPGDDDDEALLEPLEDADHAGE